MSDRYRFMPLLAGDWVWLPDLEVAGRSIYGQLLGSIGAWCIQRRNGVVHPLHANAFNRLVRGNDPTTLHGAAYAVGQWVVIDGIYGRVVRREAYALYIQDELGDEHFFDVDELYARFGRAVPAVPPASAVVQQPCVGDWVRLRDPGGDHYGMLRLNNSGLIRISLAHGVVAYADLNVHPDLRNNLAYLPYSDNRVVSWATVLDNDNFLPWPGSAPVAGDEVPARQRIIQL